jgi:hypothetical protein
LPENLAADEPDEIDEVRFNSKIMPQKIMPQEALAPDIVSLSRNQQLAWLDASSVNTVLGKMLLARRCLESAQ